MASVIPVEKLTGRDNYNNWEFAMQAYLQHEDLWCCVIGEDKTQDSEEKSKKDTRARSKIIMSVHSSIFVHIRNLKSSTEIWNKLKEVFQDKGLSRRVSLMRKMISTKMEDCTSMEEYIREIVTAAQMLNDINFEVKEEWIGAFLLAGLPEKYKPMIMAMESSGVNITGDFVKSKLLQEDCKENSSDGAALLTKSHRNKKKSKSRCFNCHQPGHFANKCKFP